MLRNRIIAGALLWLLGSWAALAGVTTAELDALVQKHVDAGRFSGAVLAAKGDEVLLQKGYGLADRAWNIPNQPDTSILVGSVSKQFAAVLALQLVHEGKLDLHAPISAYLPDFPKDKGDIITVHHLLCHSSGLPHYAGFSRIGVNIWEYGSRHVPVADYVDLIGKLHLEFQPGEKHSYSSMGYIVLGYIIEKVSGRSFTDVMAERIAKPLKLTGTGFHYADRITPRLARGYMLDWQDGPQGLRMAYSNEPYRDQSNKYCTGGVHSTVADMHRWALGLVNHRLLPKALTDKMFTPQADNYGYGWSIDKDIWDLGPDTEVISHGGSLSGYKASVAIINRGEYILAALGNSSRSWSSRVVENLARLLHGKTLAPHDVAGTRVAIAMAEEGVPAGKALFQKLKAAKFGGYNNLAYGYWANVQGMLERDRPDIAQPLAEVALTEHPGSPELHYFAAQAYKANGDAKQAIALLTKGLELAETAEGVDIPPATLEMARVTLKKWKEETP